MVINASIDHRHHELTLVEHQRHRHPHHHHRRHRRRHRRHHRQSK